MSLARCIKKFERRGKDLNKSDIAKINKYKDQGVSDIEAVNMYINSLDADLSDIVSKVERQGVTVKRVRDETTPLAATTNTSKLEQPTPPAQTQEVVGGTSEASQTVEPKSTIEPLEGSMVVPPKVGASATTTKLGKDVKPPKEPPKGPPGGPPYVPPSKRINKKDNVVWPQSTGVKSTLGGRSKTNKQKISKMRKRVMLAQSLLSDKTFRAKIDRDTDINVEEREQAYRLSELTKDVAEKYGATKLKRVSPEVNKTLVAALQGDEDAMSSLSEDIQADLKMMRYQIDYLSNEYIKNVQVTIDDVLDSMADKHPEVVEVLMNPNTTYEDIEDLIADVPASLLPRIELVLQRQELQETIRSKLGRYLHASYKAFDVKDWASQVDDTTQDAATMYFKRRIYEQKLQKSLKTNEAKLDPEVVALLHTPNPSQEALAAVRSGLDAKAQAAFDNVVASIEVLNNQADRHQDFIDDVTKIMPGINAEAAHEKAWRTMRSVIEKGTAYDKLSGYIKEHKVGQRDFSILKKKNEALAPEVKALLGEYEEIGAMYTKSATLLSNLVYNERFLNKLKDIGTSKEENWLWKEGHEPIDREFDTIASKTDTSYAPLSGMSIDKDINLALEDILHKNNFSPLMRKAVLINGAVKFGKTVLSPVTTSRNFLSGALFAVGAGHYDWAGAVSRIMLVQKDGKALVGHGTGWKSEGGQLRLRTREERHQHILKLVKLGVMHDAVHAGEFMDNLADSNFDIFLEKFDNPVVTGVQNTIKLAETLYRFGDDFWKMVGWDNEVRLIIDKKLSTEDQQLLKDAQAEGVSMKIKADAKKLLDRIEQDAADKIRDEYPTYSLTGLGVKWLRQNVVVSTFPTFSAEIIRTTANKWKAIANDYAEHPEYARHKIGGIIGAGASIYALQLAAFAALGLDDDDEEAIRLLSAPWNRNSNILPMGHDADGNIEFIDLSFIDPYNMLKRPINALLRAKDGQIDLAEAFGSAMEETFAPFVGRDIMFGAAVDTYKNRKPSGAQVYNPAESDAKKTQEILKYLATTLDPGFVGVGNRFYKAYKGERSPSGQVYSVQSEALGAVGMRVTTFDPRVSLKFRAYEFNDISRSAGSILKRQMRDPNIVTESDLQDAYKRTRNAKEKAFKQMIKIVKAAAKADVAEEDIRSMLKSTRVNQGNIDALIGW